MKLEQQVCSLELARKLKKLGVKQDSLFWWVEIMENYKWTGEYELEYEIPDYQRKTRSISAFTVAELGEMLPKGFLAQKISNRKTSKNKYRCHGYMEDESYYIPTLYANSEANARAKMLIYLLENNLTK